MLTGIWGSTVGALNEAVGDLVNPATFGEFVLNMLAAVCLLWFDLLICHSKIHEWAFKLSFFFSLGIKVKLQHTLETFSFS